MTWRNINIFEGTKFIRLGTIKLHIFCMFQLDISKIVNSVAKKPQNFYFCAFAQSQPLKSLLFLHFSKFLLEILKLASQLNLAAIALTRFLNFEFNAFLANFSTTFRKKRKRRYSFSEKSQFNIKSFC